MWKICSAAGSEPAICGVPYRVTPFVCDIQNTNDSADTLSTRHGQNQEGGKNANYWIEFFFFEFFLTEKI